MSRLSLSLLPLLVLAACNDHMQVGSVFIKSGNIDAAGGSLTITAADYASLAGTSIVIPPGAFAAKTRVGIGLSDADLVGAGMRAGGPAVFFAALDATPSASASITVPFDTGSSVAQLRIHALIDGALVDVSSRVKQIDPVGLITFELDRLGAVQVNLLSPCDGTNGTMGGDCPDAGAAMGHDAGAAMCGAGVCPDGQVCDTSDHCVDQCGLDGTVFCPTAGQLCDLTTHECH